MEQDIAGDEWLYFSDPGLQRSLFMAHHEPDTVKDSYFNYSDSMTVFGFGRSNDPLEAQLTAVGQTFHIRLAERHIVHALQRLHQFGIQGLNRDIGKPGTAGPGRAGARVARRCRNNVSIPALLRWRTLPVRRDTGSRLPHRACLPAGSYWTTRR